VRTLVLGRSPFADVVVAEASVAPHHAELTITDDGRLYLVDCASKAGTWRQGAARGDGQDHWLALRQDFVAADEPLRLGDYRCTAAGLLRVARDAPARAGETAAMAAAQAQPGDGGRQPLRGRVERDALTGEIVRRRP
jgi:hypothetical protein